MSDSLRCPQCGSELPADSGGGSCPQCLLKMALETETHPDKNPPNQISEEDTGRQFGPYEAIRLLGRGGMGAVYLAEQQQPIRRVVALKLIKPGMDSRAVIARFESERQALALMDHPNIARVFDAGSGDDGRPYFAMEYVPGIPITEYCDRHRLTNRERLELFFPICHAVQHAHQKGIIHRDIKPSNVLVSVQDGAPVPKVIDFGIAKAINQKLSDQTFLTDHGMLIGTPEYMSPEQATSWGVDIDTRSDVYSLGVVLYELLVGTLPFDFRKVAFGDALQRLREQDAPPPSAKLRGLRAESVTIGRSRRADLTTLARQLRGDADAIVLKALEKDRARRYSTPLELAADIKRYLRHEPVTARAPSLGYRARKYVRRHWIQLGAFSPFFMVLFGIWVMSYRETIHFANELVVVRGVNDFLQNDVLGQAAAVTVSGPSGLLNPVRTALDRAAARISGKLDRQPDVEASIRDSIGQTYLDLGLYPEARIHLERALELHRRVSGAEDPKTLKTMSRLGRTAELQGRYPEAELLLSQAVEIQRRLSMPANPRNPDLLYSMNNLVRVYRLQGKQAQAETLYRQIPEVNRLVSSPGHPNKPIQ